MSFVKSPASLAWRLPIACQMIFAFFVLALVLGLPESPRYLYKHGRNDEALHIFCDVYDGQPERAVQSGQSRLPIWKLR